MNPALLGMSKVISEDALRRALPASAETERVAWLDAHVHESVWPLLDAGWVLDVDTTIKPLYGRKARWCRTTQGSQVGRRTGITPT